MQNLSVTVSPYTHQKDITLLSVKGYIDTTTAPEFEKAFQTVLGKNKFNLIVDLKEVTYISSVGWGIFIGEIKRIRNQSGNLFLVAMNEEVEEAYKLLELQSIIKSFSNTDLAVRNGFTKLKMAEAPVKPVGKASEKPKSKKASAKSRVEPVPETAPMGVGMGEAPGAGSLTIYSADTEEKKPGWLGKVFKPWKWF